MFTAMLIIHALGWALYLGGMAGDLTTKIFTEQRRHPLLVARMFEKFQFTDIWVTQFQVAALSASGYAIVRIAGVDFWANPWLATGFVLFAVSGVLFYIGLLPTQGQIAKKTAGVMAVDHGGYDWQAYDADDKRWVRWANIVVIASFLAFICELVAVAQSPAIARLVAG